MSRQQLELIARKIERFFPDASGETRTLMLSAYDNHRGDIEIYQEIMSLVRNDNPFVDFSTARAYYGRRNDDMTMPILGTIDGKEYLIRQAVAGDEFSYAVVRLDPMGRPFFTVHKTRDEASSDFLSKIPPRKIIDIEEF